MKVKVDAQGRFVIPAIYRRGLGVEDGGTIDVRHVDGRIELRRDPDTVHLGHGPSGLPVISVDGMPTLSNDDALAAIDDDRAAR